MIHLAEVQAFSGGKNVATEGKASQSSTNFNGRVEYAIDGNTDGEFQHRSVTHTAIEKDPWLEIDLGSSRPIQRLVIWNRTDGGDSISNRIAGYRVALLDSQRKEVWSRTPNEVPSPDTTLVPDGSIRLDFTAALADHEQKGFPADSVLVVPPSSDGGSTDGGSTTDGVSTTDGGWAVAPQQGKAHELTLVLREPLEWSEGLLTFHLIHASKHPRHLLDRFRIRMTSDRDAAQWAKVPTSIRHLIPVPEEELNTKQRDRLAEYYRSIATELEPLRVSLRERRAALDEMKPLTTVPIMRELADAKRRTTNVQIRGNYLSTGQEVTEGVPAAFHPLPDDIPADRLALAKWLVDPQNPLTARVIVNRHWEEIFGTGIVQTSEEFGSQGELPSHPELLDWLAVELVDSGWDLKHLLKRLVMSSTYRQSSYCSETNQEC